MRLSLVLLLVAGCRVSDVTFSGPGVGTDGGNGSGDAQSGDAGGDAAVSVGMLKGYIIDGQGGVYRVAKSGFTGELSLASTVATPVLSTGFSRTGAVGKAGDTLTVIKSDNATARFHSFAIDPTTGALTFVNDFNGGGCPYSPALHPNGGWIATGCSGPDYLRMKLNANGSLFGSVLWTSVTNGGPTATVFSPAGTCLYIAGGGASGGVHPYVFDPVNGTHTAVSATTTPNVLALAVQPNGATLYAARSGSLVAYRISTTCEMTLMPGSQPIGTTVHHMLVDPSGQYLFVLGDQIHSFTVAGDGTIAPVTGSPFLAAGSYLHAIMDPAVPTKLYVTTPAGTFAAPLTAGAVAAANPVAGGTDSRWFVLAP